MIYDNETLKCYPGTDRDRIETNEKQNIPNERDEKHSAPGSVMWIAFASFTGTKVIKMAFLVVVVNHLEVGFSFTLSQSDPAN